MTHRQEIVKDDASQRIGSVGLIAAAVLLVIGNLLMPYTTDPTGDIREMLRPLGEQAFRSQASSLFIVLGFWAMLIGMAGVSRSINAGGAAWARIGFNSLLAGTALQILTLGMDIATASSVANWLAAPEAGKEAAWSTVAALNALGRGVVPVTWIIYWLAFALLGLGMAQSAVYPRWLGWAGVILSAPVIAVGILHVFTARTTVLTLAFVLFAMLTNLWALVVGIWLARRAWQPVTGGRFPAPNIWRAVDPAGKEG